jgi:hypothetical protein
VTGTILHYYVRTMDALHFQFSGMVLTPAGPRLEPPPGLNLSPADSSSITRQFTTFIKEHGDFSTNCPLPGDNRIVIVSLVRVKLTSAFGFVSLAIPGKPPMAKAALAMLPNLDPAEDAFTLEKLRVINELRAIPDGVFMLPLKAGEPLNVFYLPDEVSASTAILFTFGKLLAAAFFSQLGVGQRE